MAGDVFNCGFEARLEAVSRKLEQAYRETGHRALYFISVTDEVDRLQEKARKAVKAGAQGLLLTYSAGYSALKVLASDAQVTVPLLLHVSHMVSLLPSISFTALAKFGRLAGADMMLVPTMWSSYQVGSLEEGLRTAYALQQELYGMRRTWPLPGGGVHPGLVPLIVSEYGPDVVLLAGGGLLGHPNGATAGAQAFRQAVDAVMAERSLEDWAKEPGHEALRQALDQWGTFERPRTPWGYSSAAYRPRTVRRA
jgi:2,3-diketo-5-methylthiopentyl-1-phosphate enolase